MPTLATFYGIIVRMFYRDHVPPHIHAEYQGEDVLYDFDGNSIKGTMPSHKDALMKAWIVLHRDELEAYWKLASEQVPIPPLSIAPLK